MRKAIFAGSFEPPHLGHLDLIRRARAIVDELVVAIAINRDKPGRIPVKRRTEWLERCVSSLPGVKVVHFQGLVVDLLVKEQASLLVRGVRSHRDFESERDMALVNRRLAGQPFETILLVADPELVHISSSRIREVASFGGDIRSFLPKEIAGEVHAELHR